MIIAVIQARMSSQRLPGKVLATLAGVPMLEHVVDRVRRARHIDRVIVATSVDGSDDPIAKYCQEHDIPVYRGALDDVLGRFAGAVRETDASTIVRVTGDDPLMDPYVIDQCIERFQRGAYDYLANTVADCSTFPRGLDFEVFSRDALERADSEASRDYEREHVTPYIWENSSSAFRIGPALEAPPEYRADFRLTVDHPEDMALIRKIYEIFYKKGEIIPVPEVIAFLKKHPELAALNAHKAQKPIRG